MPLTHNLTKLDGDYPPPTSFGAWTKSARLDAMADAIDPAVTEVEIDSLKSVPDPWARPLLFNQALTVPGKKKHIAWTDAVEQWRGLLALLALRHFYKSYILKVHVTDLAADDQQAQGAGDERINADFRTVLSLLLPHRFDCRRARLEAHRGDHHHAGLGRRVRCAG